MTSPHDDSQTLSPYLDFDEEVDYGCDTSVHDEELIVSSSPMPEARPRSAPNLFAEGGKTNAPSAQRHSLDVGYTTITNPLD